MIQHKIETIPWAELSCCGGEKATHFPELLKSVFSGGFFESRQAYSRLMREGLNAEVTPYVIDILIGKLSERNDRDVSGWDLYDFINETRWSGGEQISVYSGRETTLSNAVYIAQATGIDLFTADLLNDYSEIRRITTCLLHDLYEVTLVGLEQQSSILESLFEKEDDEEVSVLKQVLLLMLEGQDPKKIVLYYYKKWFKTIEVYEVDGKSRLSELIVAHGWFKTEEALNRFYDNHKGIPINEF